MEFCFLLSNGKDSMAAPAVVQTMLLVSVVLVLKVHRVVVGSWKLLQIHMKAQELDCKSGTVQRIPTGRRLSWSAGTELQLEPYDGRTDRVCQPGYGSYRQQQAAQRAVAGMWTEPAKLWGGAA